MGNYTKSSINFGIEITANNKSLDFKTSIGGPEKQATLRVGLYSLTSLSKEIARAMSAADSSFTYTVSVDRTVSGGQQNRFVISTGGSYLSLLFASGSRAASSIASLIGFFNLDRTGATSYTGNVTAGTQLLPTYPPQDFKPLGSIFDGKRTTNDSTGGRIETVSFTTFRNFQFKFKWIEEDSQEYQLFQSLLVWLLRGGPIEFNPDISDISKLSVGVPIDLRVPVELDRMTPNFYDYFETQLLKFREMT